MFKDYYAILEVTQNATFEEIRKAYKKQSKKWHPDKNIGKDVTSIMQDINEAYDVLKDFYKRQEYDVWYSKFQAERKVDTAASLAYEKWFEENFAEYFRSQPKKAKSFWNFSVKISVGVALYIAYRLCKWIYNMQ